MHGPDVKHAQALLAANTFRQNFDPGPMDGQFGEATARACIRAHYWVGDAKPQNVFGPRLEAFLLGTRELPAANARRRHDRLKAKTAQPLRVKALAYLTSHLGEKEDPPGSNRISWASEWYGVIGPWCAMSVTRSYVEAGSKAFKRGRFYAYVPFIVADARAGRNGLAVTHDPKPGDLVCYDWQRDGTADHVGLFEKWLVRGRTFTAIEGNTAIGNDSNGGEVMRRDRSVGLVQAFVHVGR
jgi:hypothetical protein